MRCNDSKFVLITNFHDMCDKVSCDFTLNNVTNYVRLFASLIIIFTERKTHCVYSTLFTYR